MPRPRRKLLPADARRQQLLDAAVWVFARKGYRQASISDVIARAGVARGTFYLHFESKDAVFLAIVEDFHRRIASAVAAADAGAAIAGHPDPRRALQASFRRWLGFFAAHRDAAVVILKDAAAIDPRFDQGYRDLRASLVRHFTTRYTHFQALGLVRRSVSAEILAHLLVGMVDELLNAFVLRDPGADLDALSAQLADIEWNGIRPDREV